MNISIIGLGLLGGSTALALREAYADARILGVENNPEHAQQALSLGIADVVMALEEAVGQSDLVIMAIPVSAIVSLLPQVLNRLPEKAVVTDLGSTKESIGIALAAHPRRERFVAAHPIAGTERSGPTAAFKELLPGKQMILCDTDRSDADAVALVETVFGQHIGMHLSYMTAPQHDRHLAYVSHLSHVVAYALSNTVLDADKDERSIFETAGSGFSSMVRIAHSPASMWAPIFMQNDRKVSEALGEYIEHLQQFKEMLDAGDEAGCQDWIRKANDIHRILAGVQKL